MPIEIYGYSDRAVEPHIKAVEYIGLSINKSKSLGDDPRMNLCEELNGITPEQLTSKIVIKQDVDSIIIKLSNIECAEIHVIACTKPLHELIAISSKPDETFQVIYDFVVKASNQYKCMFLGQPLNNYDRIGLFSHKQVKEEQESEEKEYISLKRYALLD